MADIPNTRFINFVDTPASIQFSQSGAAQVNLDPQTGGVIDLSGFRKASIRVGGTTASSFEVTIGKISGSTLSKSYSHAVDKEIHTYDVVGPQMSLWLTGGSPNHKEKVQLWVYLTS